MGGRKNRAEGDPENDADPNQPPKKSVHMPSLPAVLRLELQPESPPQVRVRQRKCFHVFQVWPEVPAQAELCLPPEAETQDRVRDDRPVRLRWFGRVPRGVSWVERDISSRGGAAAHKQCEQPEGELGNAATATGLV